MEIVYYVAMSVDGYLADSEGGVDWLNDYNDENVAVNYAEFHKGIDVTFLGSRTYEQALGFGEWSYSDKPCWVFSRRQLSDVPENVYVTTKSPTELVAELQERELRRAWLMGGGRLAASFQAAGLISEYLIAIVPVILGSGIPLFAEGAVMGQLNLVEHKSYPNGLIQLRYLRAS